MPKRGTKKLTPNQQRWQSLVERGQRIVDRNASEGHILVDYTIPDTRPKRITRKRLQELDKLTQASTIEAGSVFIELETGEMITDSYTARKMGLTQELVQILNNSTKSFTDMRNFNADRLKGWEATVFENFFNSIEKYNGDFQTAVHNWINSIIATYGYNATARMLEEGAQQGHLITYREVYEEGAYQAYVARMLNYLPNSDIYGQEIKDAIFNDDISYEPPSWYNSSDRTGDNRGIKVTIINGSDDVE